MPRFRSPTPSAPDFHPEFGYLCPSPRKRRVLRLAALSIAATLTIGATGLAARWSGHDQAASADQLQDDQSPAKPLADVAPARPQESCKASASEDMAAYFLCGPSKLHARHGGRASNRVATVIIGHTDPVPVAAAAVTPEKSANAAAAERTVAAKKPKAKAPIALSPSAREELARQYSTDAGAISAYADTTPHFRRNAWPFGDIFGQPPSRSGFGRSW